MAILNGASRTTGLVNRNAFLDGLQDLGYRDGKDIDIVQRYADGDIARLPALAQELVALAPDVIFTANPAAAIEIRKLTATVPIVCPNLVDPVGLGLAESHNRPGGNVTGILITQDGLIGKQLELLIELVPHAAAIAVLMNPAFPTHAGMFREAEATGGRWPVKLIQAHAGVADDLEAAFAALQRDRADGVIVLTGEPIFTTERVRIVALAAAARVPALYGNREDVQNGGLISYGVNVAQNFRRAAYFADRILKGGLPADLPIEFPVKLELAINLKTAKALAIDVPPTLLVRADEVIE
jgi:putative ABC transport system substrate-binding protein